MQPDWIIEMLDRLEPDLREDFEERAAIMQFSGDGISQDHAECLALLCIIRSAALAVPYLVGENTSKGEHHAQDE